MENQDHTHRSLQKKNRTMVFGAGVSGLSAMRELMRRGQFVDLIDANDQSSLQRSYSQEMMAFHKESEFDSSLWNEMDSVILSPGIPRTHPLLKQAHTLGIPIMSEVELALSRIDQSEKKIIAVTGTNGKTTTVTLMDHLLKSVGVSSFLAGNVGTPLCEYQGAENFIVLELSSFQLESITTLKPRVACFLNLELSHEERYQGLEDYGLAKLRVTQNLDLSSHFIYPQEEDWIQSKVSSLSCSLHPFSPSEREEVLRQYDLTQWRLKGEHNRVNLAVCLKALGLLGFQGDSLQKGIKSFDPLPHRMEEVQVSSLSRPLFYNDSKSTNPLATQKALECFPEGGVDLIFGGQVRDWGQSLLSFDFPLHLIKNLYLFGESREKIKEEVIQINQKKSEFQKIKGQVFVHLTLEDVINSLSSKREGVVLFSPGHPSFDQFKNYQKRGEEFISLVKNMSPTDPGHCTPSS